MSCRIGCKAQFPWFESVYVLFKNIRSVAYNLLVKE